jgi:hypothetical protein
MQKRSSGGCSSFLILLFFVFLVLKLAGAIDWSWWWVFSPLWLPAALLLVTVAVLAVTGVSAYQIVTRVFRKRGVVRGIRQAAANGKGSKPDILEAVGSEVPMPPDGGRPVRGLPAAPEVPSVGESADASVTGPGGPSA